MHPAEVVVWFKKLAKLLGEVFREGKELLQLAWQENKPMTQVRGILEGTSLIPIPAWE